MDIGSQSPFAKYMLCTLFLPVNTALNESSTTPPLSSSWYLALTSLERRTNHIAHNASLPTILSNCRCHMISSFQNGLDGGTSAASVNVRKSKMLYSYFVDTEYSSVLTVFSLPFLKLKCVFGRVSFPGSLLERRMTVVYHS